MILDRLAPIAKALVGALAAGVGAVAAAAIDDHVTTGEWWAAAASAMAALAAVYAVPNAPRSEPYKARHDQD